MAKLIESLAISGSRLSDGTPNASGKVWVYVVGTTHSASAFSDADGTAVLSQPIVLDGAGRATIYVDQIASVLVETAAGATVATYDVSDSPGVVRVQNAGFTGTLPSGSQGAGGDTDLDTVLTSALTSFGGANFTYRDSAGATARTIADWFRQVWISAKDYGAVGNGIIDDSSAVQAAANRVAALGGGVVYFPPGTYLTSAIAIGTAGVALVGAGATVSIIKNSTAGSSAVTFSGANGAAVRDLTITNSNASNTATALSFVSCLGVVLTNVVASTHATAVNFSGFTAQTRITNCVLGAAAIDATCRGVLYNTSGSLHSIVSSRVTGALGTGVEFASSASLIAIVGNQISGSVNSLLFNNAYTGTRVHVLGNDLDGGTVLSFGTLTTIPAGLQLVNNSGTAGGSADGYSVNVTSGGTVIPDLSKGQDIKITGTSTGVSYTIAAPAALPHSTVRGYVLMLTLKNGAGSAVTGWILNAVYHLNTTVPTTDGFTNVLTLLWDGSVFHETARAVSPT